jgi:ribosomal protein S6
MKIYEITFITLEEPKDSAVKNELEAAGGKILSISSMGQKTFVYPIKKQKSGYYTTYLFEMEPEKAQAFDRKLGLGEEVLRHLTVVLKPSEIAVRFPSDAQKATEIESKSLEKALAEPETELMLEPELALEVEPEKEIVAEEIPTESEKVEEIKVETTEKTEKEVKKADTKTAAKETKKPVEKVTKEETKVVEKVEKLKKAVEPMAKTKPAVEPVDEEERLEALDKKLEELLKD